MEQFSAGQILVTPEMSGELLPLLRMAKGLVIESNDDNGSAAMAGLALDIPVIAGAAGATSQLKSGTEVIVDATQGIVQPKLI
ncbi:hypothetical protein SDC9_197741 [bioreactor metagenome]|uniref:PEP-utilising enzyme mobile domain-containing protein n=1 Tax=bioreactor metagenome TaxID=1076179 RepID=A0A645IFP9_9ZZZZ